MAYRLTSPGRRAFLAWLETGPLRASPPAVHITGEIGPLEALFPDHDVEWRELGVIAWRVHTTK